MKSLNTNEICVQLIKEIREHRKKGTQAALKLVCYVALLGYDRNKTNMKSVKDLIQSLFDSVGDHLSTDVKTKYAQAVLYIQSNGWKGSAEELFQKCIEANLTSCRKLSDAYAERLNKKHSDPAPSKMRKRKTFSSKTCRVKGSTKTVAKKKPKLKSSQKPKTGYWKKIERLIKDGQKKRASCVLEELGVKITVNPI